MKWRSVVGSGDDGTQHEIATAVMGTGKPMGILPGGTGNGHVIVAPALGRDQPILKTLNGVFQAASIDWDIVQQLAHEPGGFTL